MMNKKVIQTIFILIFLSPEAFSSAKIYDFFTGKLIEEGKKIAHELDDLKTVSPDELMEEMEIRSFDDYLDDPMNYVGEAQEVLDNERIWSTSLSESYLRKKERESLFSWILGRSKYDFKDHVKFENSGLAIIDNNIDFETFKYVTVNDYAKNMDLVFERNYEDLIFDYLEKRTAIVSRDILNIHLKKQGHEVLSESVNQYDRIPLALSKVYYQSKNAKGLTLPEKEKLFGSLWPKFLKYGEMGAFYNFKKAQVEIKQELKRQATIAKIKDDLIAYNHADTFLDLVSNVDIHNFSSQDIMRVRAFISDKTYVYFNEKEIISHFTNTALKLHIEHSVVKEFNRLMEQIVEPPIEDFIKLYANLHHIKSLHPDIISEDSLYVSRKILRYKIKKNTPSLKKLRSQNFVFHPDAIEKLFAPSLNYNKNTFFLSALQYANTLKTLLHLFPIESNKNVEISRYLNSVASRKLSKMYIAYLDKMITLKKLTRFDSLQEKYREFHYSEAVANFRRSFVRVYDTVRDAEFNLRKIYQDYKSYKARQIEGPQIVKSFLKEFYENDSYSSQSIVRKFERAIETNNLPYLLNDPQVEKILKNNNYFVRTKTLEEL